MIANLPPGYLTHSGRLGGVSLALAPLLDVVSFMVLYISALRGASTWRDILPGAVGAGVLWELAKKAFLTFVTTYIIVSNLVYGSVAAVIAFLAWAYLTSLIFLFGAYLSVARYRLRQQREVAVPGAKVPRRTDCPVPTIAWETAVNPYSARPGVARRSTSA